MADAPRRSRFDSGDSERPSRSRFDREDSNRPRSRFDSGRRSRSPRSREPEPESRRTRSPPARGASDSPANTDAPKINAAALAAAAAAKINAQIQAKKGIQHVEVPPIRAVRFPSFASSLPRARPHLQCSQVPSPAAPKSPTPKSGSAPISETYQQDGDYIKDIEINDLRNRYTLTKGAVQKKVYLNFCCSLIFQGQHLVFGRCAILVV